MAIATLPTPSPIPAPKKIDRRRQRCGRRAEEWGRAAEDAVARWYEDRGARVIDRRARTEGGEIDLVVERQGAVVFVEVKARRTLDEALGAVGAAGQARLARAATSWMAARSGSQDCRLDVAAVDRRGAVAVVENLIAE